MTKSKPQQQPRGVSCTAYTVGKSGTNNAQSFEIKIVDGRVVEVREVSRAPDMAAVVIGGLIDRLWHAYRNQRSEALLGVANDKQT